MCLNLSTTGKVSTHHLFLHQPETLQIEYGCRYKLRKELLLSFWHILMHEQGALLSIIICFAYLVFRLFNLLKSMRGASQGGSPIMGNLKCIPGDQQPL